jgi:trans-2,3-dihydro-3-hydroxyanthranilate isomerase
MDCGGRLAMPTRRAFRYRVVDVFTTQPLEGNQLAVFPDSCGLDDATMQNIAKELNLAETTFFCPATRPGCVVRVRIFTPACEMPFAGHPTIGASFVLLEEGIVAKNTKSFAVDEAVGAIAVRVETGERPMIWLRTPPITVGKKYDRMVCAQALGLTPDVLLEVPPEMVSAANHGVFIAVKDKQAVDRACLDLRSLPMLKGSDRPSIFIFVFTPTSEGAYSRMFAPDLGIAEDPATGGATGPLAAFMMRHGLVSSADGTRFVSEQGAKMGRRSFLHVLVHGHHGADGIDVGGYVTPLIEATMTL